MTGSDASDFLQGQLTNDLGRLAAEPEILAAWCNPKGRVIWFGTVSPVEDGYALAAPADMAADIVARLTLYRFRSKVDFEVVEGDASVDPAELIQKGLAWIDREQSEQFTPHMLNLDLVDAVSFDKGCYTGQEIVARTHYKGATKRRLHRFAADGVATAGSRVSDGERDVGEVLNVAGTELLAVVPVNKTDRPLTAGGIGLKLLPLPYLAQA